MKVAERLIKPWREAKRKYLKLYINQRKNPKKVADTLGASNERSHRVRVVEMKTMDARETARLELQERLDTAKTQAERNRLGQFATPPELASEIISYADSLLPQRSKIHFLEPGFGTGPFYSALLRHVPPSRIEAAAGYEIDSHYAEPAKSFWKSTGLRLHIGSFTEAEPPKAEAAKYNLIVCNPPYVRHHHLSQTQKRELQAAVARYLDFEMNGLGEFAARGSRPAQRGVSRPLASHPASIEQRPAHCRGRSAFAIH